MLSLSPAKLLVILVIALIVLGPEKLPQVARQLGAAWHDLRRWRSRIESEVRGTFPNLPPAHEVAQAVRSPFSFLDRLADEHEKQSANPAVPPPPTDADVGPPPAAPDAVASNGRAPDGAPSNGSAGGTGTTSSNGHAADGPPPAAAGGRTPGGLSAVPDDPSMN